MAAPGSWVAPQTESAGKECPGESAEPRFCPCSLELCVPALGRRQNRRTAAGSPVLKMTLRGLSVFTPPGHYGDLTARPDLPRKEGPQVPVPFPATPARTPTYQTTPITAALERLTVSVVIYSAVGPPPSCDWRAQELEGGAHT